MDDYLELWLMLTNNEFKLENPLMESLKCSICGKLLINSCIGKCGCKYCWRCISKYLGSQAKKCPGNGEKCRYTNADLSLNVTKDCKTNATISKLKAKCLSGACDYRSNLLEMVSHMKTCEQNLLLCPFNEMGCPAPVMRPSELSTHLIEQMSTHNIALNDWAMNIKNDILAHSLIKKEELVNLCTAQLQEALDAKISEAIPKQSFKEHDDALKDLKKQFEDLANLFTDTADDSSETIRQLTDANMQQMTLIEELRKDKETLTKKIMELQNQKRVLTNEPVAYTDWIGQSDTTPRLHFATLTWNIINMVELREKGSSYESDLFRSCCNSYAMRLYVQMTGCELHRMSHICIEIRCYENTNTLPLVQMPQARISITTRHQTKKKAFIMESKSIQKVSTRSDRIFHFKYADLKKKGVLDNGEISIECTIDKIN